MEVRQRENMPVVRVKEEEVLKLEKVAMEPEIVAIIVEKDAAVQK